MTAGAHARRWRTVGAVTLIAVMAGGVGWGAAQFVRSPAQVAADAAAPPASVITAPVEERVLEQTLVTRGTVAPAQAAVIRPRASTEGEPIVTALPIGVGGKVEAGDVLLEVAGRPVFAIRGAVPAYRDLVPGSEGEDVRQLQTALTEMGYPVPADGRYGAGTANAVDSWYADAGFDAAPAVIDGESLVEAAQAQVKGAERALEDVRDSGASAPPRQLARATEDLDTARDALAAAQARTGASVPASEIAVLASFPAEVREVGLEVGAVVGEGTITVSTGELGVTSAIAPHMTGLVREGQRVELASETLGQQASASVTTVNESPSSPSTDAADPAANQPKFAVAPSQPLPPEWNGQDVRVTIVAASSDAAVLVVPLAAVSADAGQRTRVFVVGEAEERREVEVRTGIVGDGFVQVTPVSGGLGVGDRVFVGASGPAPQSGSP